MDAQSQKVSADWSPGSHELHADTVTSSSGYTLYATTTYTYDAEGDRLSMVSPDGSTTNSTYNDLGQATSTV